MSVEGLVVGVDLDGVCADFYGRMREIAAEWFECKVAMLTENVSFGLSGSGTCGRGRCVACTIDAMAML